MDAKRITRMRKAMQAESLDALILRLPENITLLGGYYPLTGLNFLLLPREDEATLVVPASEEAEVSAGWWKNIRPFEFGTLAAGNAFETIEKLLKDAAVSHRPAWKRIGYEGSFESVAPALLSGEGLYPAGPTHKMYGRIFAGAELVDCTDLLQRERARKTDQEISRLQRAGHIADAGLRAFKESITPGRTEAEVAGLVAAAVLNYGVGEGGAQRVQAFPQVASGAENTARAWRPCGITSNRTIRDGDLVILELGVVADGFWADVTRTCGAGKPVPKQEEVYEIVKEAQEAARDRVAAGVPCGEIDWAARTVVEQAGLGPHFFHVTGHGLGFRYHEPAPTLCPGNTALLESGMVFSIEPGVYLPGFGGIRIEDNLAVTNAAVLTLTSFDRRLRGGA